MKLVARPNENSIAKGQINFTRWFIISLSILLLVIFVGHGTSEQYERIVKHANDKTIFVTSNRPNKQQRLAATDVIEARLVRSLLHQDGEKTSSVEHNLHDSGHTIKAADEGSCTMRLVSRYPRTSARGQLLSEFRIDNNIHDDIIGSNEINTHHNERALICSQISGYNYEELVRGFYEKNNTTAETTVEQQQQQQQQQKLPINQLHFDSGQSQFVFAAIDLICHLFDCSNLLVFNLTEQEIHDHKALAVHLSSWLSLEVLDLTSTSLESIKFIQLPVMDHHNHNSSINSSITSNNITTTFINTTVTGGGGVKLKTSVTSLYNLTHLHLDENKLSELDFDYLLERMPRLKCLTLANNTIYNIHCSANLSLCSHLANQFELINLAGNVINCDKSQLWLLRQFYNNYNNLTMLFVDHDKINCSAPLYLNDMTWSQRVSVMETKICEDCACRSLKRTAISVDCHRKNLTSLPDVLPLNTKILNLTSNSISTLGVPERAQNWENVTYVYLENNLISSFQQPLSGNSKFLRNLAALDIRRNRFQEFPNHILEQFINLDQVHLSNNPWLCECESTFAFQEWLQRQFHKVGDKEEIRCGSSGTDKNGLRSVDLQQELSSRVIYKLSKSELCPQHNADLPKGYDWLDVVNVMLAVSILLILLKVVMDYIYQHRTKRLPHFFKLNI